MNIHIDVTTEQIIENMSSRDIEKFIDELLKEVGVTYAVESIVASTGVQEALEAIDEDDIVNYLESKGYKVIRDEGSSN